MVDVYTFIILRCVEMEKGKLSFWRDSQYAEKQKGSAVLNGLYPLGVWVFSVDTFVGAHFSKSIKPIKPIIRPFDHFV